MLNNVKDIAQRERYTLISFDQFIKKAYQFVYTFPYVLSMQELYGVYKKLCIEHESAENALKSQIVKEEAKAAAQTSKSQNLKNEFNIKAAPWRSQDKYLNFVLSDKDNINIPKPEANCFNIKGNRKKYMLKCVAKPYTLMIDYVYFNQHCYLLAVNVNTRKAYIINTLAKYNPETGKIKADKYEAIRQLRELALDTPIKQLIYDGESAWASNDWQSEILYGNIDVHVERKCKFDDKGIPNHTTLATLNRVCRTIRNMLYNMGFDTTEDVSPDLMKYVISEYNRSPHKTLSQIFHKSTCPNDVDEFMEKVIIDQAVQHNQEVMNSEDYELPIGTPVKVYKDANVFDKVKAKTYRGDWEVIAHKGVNYTVIDHDTNIALSVPRWKLDLIKSN
jgi:hypothetical protein